MGGKFWLWVIGVALAVGIGGMILFAIIGAAWYAWGFMGTLIFLSAILLLFAWIWDHTHGKTYTGEEPTV